MPVPKPKPDPWSVRLPEGELPSEAVRKIPELQGKVLAWHARHGRHDLPWQVEDPYAVWVSEVMLQQTQVATGLYRFPSWMRRFPTLKSLAEATVDEVLKEWEGLGYYARARNLHAAAQVIEHDHGGVFPKERALRLALPGVGASTASAIGAFAFGLREAILDANVLRVWGRWWADEAPEGPAATRSRFFWGWAQAVTPRDPGQVRAWTQAMMDLGATACTPRAPACSTCPLQASCRAFALGEQEAWLPPARKTKVQQWSLDWAWVLEEGRVAVYQRPAGGPWQGLWALPEMELGSDCGALVAEGRHALSHRKIEWTIHRATLESLKEMPAPIAWVGLEDFSALALPRPLRAWWEGLGLERRLMLFGESS